MIEKIIQSEYLYPLWRIGWLERAFFLACRKFGRQEAQKLFSDILKGHDVSYYQGYIDFIAMLASGAKFVIPRLGYGVTKDIRFDEYMAGVNGVLPNNPYHFYHPELSPVAQADKVLAILDLYQQRISRVWLDMEYEWTGAYTDSKHWKTYRDGINTVYPTGIYTRATWWDSRVGTLAAEFGRDPFWVAQYSSALTLIPKGARDVLIWQSGSPTYYAGQSSPRIDYDLWNTDYNFEAEWNGAIVTPPENGATMETWKVIADKLNIRSGSSTVYTVVQSVFKGDKIEGVFDTASQWIDVSKIIRVNGSTFSPVAPAKWWCSGSALYVEKVVVTPPPPPTTTLPDVPFLFEIGDDVKYIKQTFSGILKPK